MYSVILSLIFMAAGFVLLIKGADFFVKGSSAIARKFGVPQIIIGLTIVAMGTSAPEAAVSISAALNGSADITIGNVLGSNIMNILIILGVTALIAPVAVEKSSIRIDIPFMFGVSVLLPLFGLLGRSIDRWEGVVLLLLFGTYMFYLFKEAIDSDAEEELEERPIYGQGNIWTYLMVVFGLAMIIGGSKLTVLGATDIAEALGVSQRMIGLTVVAFGTSLPELVTSATAARRGHAGLAVGNIVGSNIFNVLLVTGLTAVITPVAFIRDFLPDAAVAAAAAVVLWLFVFHTKRLGRIGGAVLLLGYAAYFIFMLL